MQGRIGYMKNIDGKIERYSLWAKRKPRYYALIGDLCIEDGDFGSACSYYRKAIEKGVLAYAALGDALYFSNQHKKALDAYVNVNKNLHNSANIKPKLLSTHPHCLKF